ncbi:hypothetical protein [Streptococcus merionis]|uniref:hypothetical protein n=1 Tax=Streptococcus merionis TaxID=400065 RepID=UPI00351456B1
MANEQNLVPMNQRTKSEAREISRKGGVASGKVRRQRADLKRSFETLLSSEVNNEQMRELLIRLGYDPTNEMALALVILQKALNGDVKAFTKIQDVIDSE